MHTAVMKSIHSRLRIASVEGRRHEILIAGAGKPVVVLANGAGGPVEAWFRVLPALETLTTVFAWNRPGIGRSDPPAAAQTSAEVVRTLRMLLAATGLAPPYLLVGHSIGGLHMNLFARLHPGEVCGVAMLDATAPDDVALMEATASRLQRVLTAASDALHDRRRLGEVPHAAASAAQIVAASAFPAMPLRVVTGMRPALRWLMPRAQLAGRAENQRRLAAMSPHGRQIPAMRSGHFPQLSEPALVVETIRELLTNTRLAPGNHQ